MKKVSVKISSQKLIFYDRLYRLGMIDTVTFIKHGYKILKKAGLVD